MKLKCFPLLLIITTALSSCKKEDDKDPSNPLPAGNCLVSSYCFQNGSGENTVYYEGQTARLNQLDQLLSYIRSYAEEGVALSEQDLLEMFSNNNGLGSQLFDAAARVPGKQLKDKCFLPRVSEYEALFQQLEELTAEPNIAGSPGVAGLVSTNDNSRTYLFDANGFEPAQLLAKGLMGDVLYYQAMEVYLTGSENGSYSNEIVSGTTYTEAEHKFDEAFGYYGVPVDFDGSVAGTLFYGDYGVDRNAALGISTPIFEAFINARTAITNGQTEVMNTEIDIIRERWSKIIYGTILHYLKVAGQNMDDPAVKCHVLSEALGFANNLLFNAENYGLSLDEINQFKAFLGDNLYNCTAEQINEAAFFMLDKSGISLDQFAAL